MVLASAFGVECAQCHCVYPRKRRVFKPDTRHAGVAKLADATALGAVVPKGLVGSNPSARIGVTWDLVANEYLSARSSPAFRVTAVA